MAELDQTDERLETSEPEACSCSADVDVEDGSCVAEGADADACAREPYETADSAEPEEIPSLILGDEAEHDADLHEEIISSDIAWRGKIFDVERLEVRLPNGRTSLRDVVRHRGAVAIVALTETGKIALVRQYRTSLDRVTVEIPAGKLDPGEEPAVAARRELREETGFVADELVPLVSVAPSPGYSDEVVHVYLAHGLRFVGASPDADEFLNVDMVDMSELVAAVLDGSVTDAKTVAGILAAHAREAALRRRSK